MKLKNTKHVNASACFLMCKRNIRSELTIQNVKLFPLALFCVLPLLCSIAFIYSYLFHAWTDLEFAVSVCVFFTAMIRMQSIYYTGIEYRTLSTFTQMQ